MQEQQLYEILKRAQEELSCAACGRAFELEELKIRGMLEKHYLVQASCHRGHAPTLVLHIVGAKVRVSDQQITTDDVLDLHQNLKTFNGDFRAAFAKLAKNQKKK